MLTNAPLSLKNCRQVGSMMLANGTYGAELAQHNMLHYGGSPMATGPLGRVPRPPYVLLPGAKPGSPAKTPAVATAVPATLVEASQTKLEARVSTPPSGTLDPTFIYAPPEVRSPKDTQQVASLDYL